jgi:hypothetical protein
VEAERDVADAAQQLLRRERVPRAVAFVVERIGARLEVHGALEDLDDGFRRARTPRLVPVGARRSRRQLSGGLHRHALTPPRKMSSTSSAIGASL